MALIHACMPVLFHLANNPIIPLPSPFPNFIIKIETKWKLSAHPLPTYLSHKLFAVSEKVFILFKKNSSQWSLSCPMKKRKCPMKTHLSPLSLNCPFGFQTLLKNKRWGNTSKRILQGQHYPDTKTRQGHYKKRKLQANIPDEHKCKIPQQNISKPNSTIH